MTTAASDLLAMTAVATPDGYAMFVVDSLGDIHGRTFTFAGDQLQTSADVKLGEGALGSISGEFGGTDIMLASLYGTVAGGATGTTLFPLGAALEPNGRFVDRDFEIGVTEPLARTNDPDGSFAFATLAAGQVDVMRVDADGTNAGAWATAVPGSESASSVTIHAAGGGYVVGYTAATTSPSSTRVALVDAAFHTIAGPVSLNVTAYGPSNSHVAWAPVSDTYLVTWFEKNVTDDDDVYMTVLGARLETIVPATIVDTHSYAPVVGSDGTGFWLSYKNYDLSPSALKAVHVSATGVVTPRAVGTSGGSPSKWAMVERYGQPVLVWAESGGSGPDLYFDPMCK
jgi:hypothetical protein